MRDIAKMLTGALAGAGMIYFLDPSRGARRRSLLSDQARQAARKVSDGLGATARDMRHRSAGLAARTTSRFRSDDASDEVLEERVRSQLGRVVSHPSAITVTARDGHVTLGGPVLASEVNQLLARVAGVRGVEAVSDELDVHERAGSTPGLQGAARPREPRAELMQEHWAPTTRLLMGAFGGLALAGRARGRGPLGILSAATGVALLARALTNMPAKRLTGIGAGRRAVDIQKTVEVAAPRDEVWALWSNFENFPRFMSHLREVQRLDDTRSHWVAAGPAGVPVEWDAEITEWIPGEAVAWKSVEGSTVANAGWVRLEPGTDGTTRIHIRLSYNPPAGAIGHAVAMLFGADPKRAMDEDMVRLQSLLEAGKTSAHGETVRRGE